MTLGELGRDRRVALKQAMLVEDAGGDGVSWGELADADRLVSDERLEERYGGTTFTEEDFA